MVRPELTYSIGGWIVAFELDFIKLGQAHAADWLGVNRTWPQHKENKHLHLGITRHTDERNLWGTGKKSLRVGETKILARRLRYRFGIDWSKPNGPSAETLFWWSTAQTESWIAQLHPTTPQKLLGQAERRSFNGTVGAAMRGVGGTAQNVDPLILTADNWGAVDLESDPITVLYLGPYSDKTDTHADVKKILARAGKQIKTIGRRCSNTTGKFALEPFTSELSAIRNQQRIAVEHNQPDVCDVIIVYRGGGITEADPSGARSSSLIDASSRMKFAKVVSELTELGIEVVLGIGHGTVGVYLEDNPDEPGKKRSTAPPAGVHEAITPTAAAAWVLREHVNHRLVDFIVDPGQSGQLVNNAI